MHIIYELLPKMRIQVSLISFFFRTAIILICCTNSAYAKHFSYIGVDLASVQANFQPGFGGDIFSGKQMAQYNIFFGHYFAPILGLELGYAQTITTKSSVFVPAMTNQFGTNFFTGIASNVYATSKTLRGFNINYVPQFALSKVISLVPVVGMSYLQVKAYLNLTQFDGSLATSIQQDDYALRFAQTKLVPRLGIRLQFLFANVGVRLGYIWEQTANIMPQATRGINPAQILTAKLKNSSTGALGVFYKF